jgi:y4mF family transcriptional regulator
MMNTIGQIIKMRRKELGLTQDTLALLSQVGINTIVSIERGSKSPSLETLTKVTDVLGLEIQLVIKK